MIPGKIFTGFAKFQWNCQCHLIHDLLRHDKIKLFEKTVEQHDLTTLSKKFRSSSLALCNGPLLIGKIADVHTADVPSFILRTALSLCGRRTMIPG